MRKTPCLALGLAAILALGSCTEGEKEAVTLMTRKPEPQQAKKDTDPKPAPKPDNAALEQATFGAGCFWCVEAVFQRLKGVVTVESGYAGGRIDNPTYEQICTGTTGHAEVCQLKYDPKKVTYPELLEVFWKTHDPTTLNRQGNDKGTQYRSVVFTHNEEQKKLAEKYKKELNASGAWGKPIVTEISAYTKFFKAEVDHQNYYNLNPNDGYCQAIIVPKLEKFRKVFKDKLKKEE